MLIAVRLGVLAAAPKQASSPEKVSGIVNGLRSRSDSGDPMQRENRQASRRTSAHEAIARLSLSEFRPTV